MNQKNKTVLKSVLVLLLFALSLEAWAAWQAPTEAPTGGQPAGPVTVGATDPFQVKSGSFGLTGNFVANRAAFLTDLGIGIDVPKTKLQVNGSASAATKLIVTGDDGSGNSGGLEVQYGTDAANNRTRVKLGINQYFGYLTLKDNADGEKVKITAKNEASYLNGGGNVGIGTTSPDTKLHVEGDMNVGDTSSGGTARTLYVQDKISLLYSGANLFSTILGPTNRVLRMDIPGNDALDGLLVRGSQDSGVNYPNNVLFAGANGKVGIGKTNPGYALDVVGDVNATRYCIGAANCINAWPTGTGTSQWTTLGTNIYYNTGNVGIGYSSPGSKLTVYGNTSIGSGYTGIAAPENGLIVEGKAGINTMTPRTKLEIGGDGSFLATGNYTVGGIPQAPQLNSSGDAAPDLNLGIRMMWNPRKAAFRAGYVSGAQWNNSNIGNASIAMGHSTTASGEASTALGKSTTASGLVSTALGQSTTASGAWSTALGTATTASGEHSIAMGYSTVASGPVSTALGMLTSASGDSSTAMGQYTSTNYASVSLGRYNVGGGDNSSWRSEDPLFEIGIGSDAKNKANAFTIMKNGNAEFKVGLIVPRFTNTQINNLPNKIEGMLVFDTTNKIFMGWNGSRWISP